MTGDPTRLHDLEEAGPEEARAEEAPFFLVCLQGPEVGRRWHLTRDGLLVGRDPDAEVCLELDTVSWHHCELRPASGGRGAHLRDLASTNGTRVDGALVSEAALAGGEQVQVGAAVLKLVDATDPEAAYHEALQREAAVDPLTGVWTRRRLLQVLERECARAARHDRPLHLMLMDVDHFKRTNDGWGHPAGDAVLRELAAVVGATVRESELFARYGGEEFALVVPESPSPKVAIHAEKIRAAVEAHPFLFEGEPLPVTLSVGVAGLPAGRATPGDLIGLADRRLYAAKAAGRNRVVFAAPYDAAPDPGAE